MAPSRPVCFGLARTPEGVYRERVAARVWAYTPVLSASRRCGAAVSARMEGMELYTSIL
jgi:hypothetical protein